MANFTTKVDHIVVYNVAKEAIQIKKFIIKLGIVPSILNPVDLYYDNNRAIAQAKEPRSHQ